MCLQRPLNQQWQLVINIARDKDILLVLVGQTLNNVQRTAKLMNQAAILTVQAAALVLVAVRHNLWIKSS